VPAKSLISSSLLLTDDDPRAWIAEILSPHHDKTKLVVSVDRGIRNHFYQLHHAAVLMREDVAVQYKLAGIINKPAAHLVVSGNCDRTNRIGSRGATRILLDVRRTGTLDRAHSRRQIIFP
jgi:hypothetical protein